MPLTKLPIDARSESDTEPPEFSSKQTIADFGVCAAQTRTGEADNASLQFPRSRLRNCAAPSNGRRNDQGPLAEPAVEILADREGFEPSIPLRVCRISSAVLSTAQPPVRG